MPFVAGEMRQRTLKFCISTTRMRPASSVRGLQARFGELVCGLVGGNAVVCGASKNLQQRVVDGLNFGTRARRLPAQEFDAAIDDAPGVGGVIGRVEDAARVEGFAVSRVEELVVRRARH